MFKRIGLVVALCVMLGCNGFTLPGFGGDGVLSPFAQSVLAACEDVPVAEFNDCVKEEFAARPDANVDNLTVGQLLEILAAAQPAE